jgi:histidine triad (HIT) family protein
MADCIFCKIARHEIKSDIVYEDGEIIAFNDLNPQAPVHVLVIPKKHIASVSGLTAGDDPLIGRIHRVAGEIAADKKIADKGFRISVNTGQDAGQAVAHIHFHLLGGRKFSWPPG